MLSRNITNETIILISTPPMMSFPVVKKGNCTKYFAVSNVKWSIYCESDGLEPKLYSVIKSNLFTQNYKAVSFKISDIECIAAELTPSNIAIQAIKSHHRVDVLGEVWAMMTKLLWSICTCGLYRTWTWWAGIDGLRGVLMYIATVVYICICTYFSLWGHYV